MTSLVLAYGRSDYAQTTDVYANDGMSRYFLFFFFRLEEKQNRMQKKDYPANRF